MRSNIALALLLTGRAAADPAAGSLRAPRRDLLSSTTNFKPNSEEMIDHILDQGINCFWVGAVRLWRLQCTPHQTEELLGKFVYIPMERCRFASRVALLVAARAFRLVCSHIIQG